jgi:hypothetical protein
MPRKSSSKKKTSKHKKKTTKTRKKRSSPRKTPGEVRVEKVLVENFVSLQKVMTNLSMKFDSLSTQISKLLDLFEISAKTLAKKDFKSEKTKKEGDQIGKKMDALMEQNKIIARGLTLLHEPIVEETQPIPPYKKLPSPQQRSPPPLPPQPILPAPKPTPPQLPPQPGIPQPTPPVQQQAPPQVPRPQTGDKETYQKSVVPKHKDSVDFIPDNP